VFHFGSVCLSRLQQPWSTGLPCLSQDGGSRRLCLSRLPPQVCVFQDGNEDSTDAELLKPEDVQAEILDGRNTGILTVEASLLHP
jgi:hypothetical protein